MELHCNFFIECCALQLADSLIECCALQLTYSLIESCALQLPNSLRMLCFTASRQFDRVLYCRANRLLPGNKWSGRKCLLIKSLNFFISVCKSVKRTGHISTLGYDAVSLDGWFSLFQRIVVPPSSGSTSQRKKFFL